MDLARSKRKAFPDTSWSDLRLLSCGDTLGRDRVLRRLASNYWTPIYAFLRRLGMDENEAQDMVQDFFAYAVETDLFAKADATRGRFRSFLIASLRNHVRHVRRHENSSARRPPNGVESLDDAVSVGCEPAAPESESPEEEFHRIWTRQLINDTVKSLKSDLLSTGKESHYRLFYSWVLAPSLGDSEPPKLMDLAKTLDLEPKEASNRIITAKRAFKRILLANICEYAMSCEDRDLEVEEVLRSLRVSEAAPA